MGPSQRHYAFLTSTSLAPHTVPGGLQSGDRINECIHKSLSVPLREKFHVSPPAGKSLPTSCPEVSSKPGGESGWASWFPTWYLPLPGFHPVESSIHEARNHLVWQWKEGLWSPMPEGLCACFLMAPSCLCNFFLFEKGMEMPIFLGLLENWMG